MPATSSQTPNPEAATNDEEIPEGAFGSRGSNVYQGKEIIAQARSNNIACRIKNALNAYRPDRRGK